MLWFQRQLERGDYFPFPSVSPKIPSTVCSSLSLSKMFELLTVGSSNDQIIFVWFIINSQYNSMRWKFYNNYAKCDSIHNSCIIMTWNVRKKAITCIIFSFILAEGKQHFVWTHRT